MPPGPRAIEPPGFAASVVPAAAGPKPRISDWTAEFSVTVPFGTIEVGAAAGRGVVVPNRRGLPAGPVGGVFPGPVAAAVGPIVRSSGEGGLSRDGRDQTDCQLNNRQPGLLSPENRGPNKSRHETKPSRDDTARPTQLPREHWSPPSEKRPAQNRLLKRPDSIVLRRCTTVNDNSCQKVEQIVPNGVLDFQTVSWRDLLRRRTNSAGKLQG